MANNTFVGFPHAGHSTSPGDPLDSDQVQEIQPVTTWSRDGGYTVTRRWRGQIDSLVAFSDGGTGNKDHAGTYFTGTSGFLLGGAGRDGAISTNIEREEGGQLGVFSATWVTSNIATRLTSGGQMPSDGSTSGDLYQESSIWTLDGNDIEKDLFDCPVLQACETTLGSNGFPARAKKAVENYKDGKDKDGANLADPTATVFLWDSYLTASEVTALQAASSILGNGNLFIDMRDVSNDSFKGVETFSFSQYVLRNVKTVQYTSSIIPSYTNVNNIWTTANIKTLMAGETRTIEPSTTSTLDYTLPLLGVLGTVLNFSKWLYRTPDVQQLNNGKWQITKEWWEADEIATSCYKAYA